MSGVDALSPLPIAVVLSREEQIEINWQQYQQQNFRWRSQDEKRAILCRLAGEQNWRCCYCGRRMHLVAAGEYGSLSPEQRATCEHIVPRALYGRYDEINLAAACSACNSARGAIMTDDHWTVLEMGFNLSLISLSHLEQLYYQKVWHND